MPCGTIDSPNLRCEIESCRLYICLRMGSCVLSSLSGQAHCVSRPALCEGDLPTLASPSSILSSFFSPPRFATLCHSLPLVCCCLPSRMPESRLSESSPLDYRSRVFVCDWCARCPHSSRMSHSSRSSRGQLTPPFLTYCTEYFKILKAVAIGFVIMGFVGFVVKVRCSPSSFFFARLCFAGASRHIAIYHKSTVAFLLSLHCSLAPLTSRPSLVPSSFPDVLRAHQERHRRHPLLNHVTSWGAAAAEPSRSAAGIMLSPPPSHPPLQHPPPSLLAWLSVFRIHYAIGFFDRLQNKQRRALELYVPPSVSSCTPPHRLLLLACPPPRPSVGQQLPPATPSQPPRAPRATCQKQEPSAQSKAPREMNSRRTTQQRIPQLPRPWPLQSRRTSGACV